MKVRRAERGDFTDGSEESITPAQSCDNCTLSEGGKIDSLCSGGGKGADLCHAKFEEAHRGEPGPSP